VGCAAINYGSLPPTFSLFWLRFACKIRSFAFESGIDPISSRQETYHRWVSPRTAVSLSLTSLVWALWALPFGFVYAKLIFDVPLVNSVLSRK